MKIAFLNSGLQARGGADRWLLGVVAGLRGARPDIETVLLVGRQDPDLPAHERARVGPVLRVKGLERRGLRRKGEAGAVGRLQEAVADADVVHCNDVVDPALLELIAATGRGVATVQDHRFFCPGPGKVLPDGAVCRQEVGPDCRGCLPDPDYRARVLDLTRRRLQALRGMRAVTVLSAYMQAELAAQGIDAHIAPPFVDHLPAQAQGDLRHHLFVGRTAEHKGIHVALAARTTLPLVIAGDGPVAVPGARWVDRRELAGLLAHAASLWVPSLWAEPFGIVGLEALARGVPAIGTARGGMGEWLVDGETGLVVPAGDAAALAQAADRLAAEPGLRHRLGEGGRRRVAERFTVGRALAALLPLWAAASGRT